MEETPENKTSEEYYKEIKETASWGKAFGNHWYKGLDQEAQIHIYVDSSQAFCAAYIKKTRKWIAGSKTIFSCMEKPSQLFEYVKDFIETPELSRCKGYAVIIHSGKETGISTLKLDYDSITERDDDIENNTKMALSISDTLADNYYTWKYMPIGEDSYGGANYVLTSDLKLIDNQPGNIKTLKGNKPIFWGFYTASTEIISLIPHLLQNPWVDPELSKKDTSLVEVDGKTQPIEVKNTSDINIMVFNYSAHTFIVPMSKSGEIHKTQISTIKHIHAEVPADLSEKLVACITQTDAVNPKIHIYGMANATPQEIAGSLDADQFAEFEDMNIDLAFGQDPADLSNILAKESNTDIEGVRVRPEFFALNKMMFNNVPSFYERIPQTIEDLIYSVPNQNFSKSQNKLIKRGHVIALLATQTIIATIFVWLLIFIGTNAYDAYKKINSEYWDLSSAEVTATNTQKQNWESDHNTFRMWEKLLTPRSHAWKQMEFLKHTVPQDSGIKISEFKYEIKSKKGTGRSKSSSLVKIWKFKGECTFEGSNYFEELRKTGNIDAFYSNFAKKYNFDEFYPVTPPDKPTKRKPKPTRPITVEDVKIDRINNSSTEFGYRFEITIQQELTKNDTYSL